MTDLSAFGGDARRAIAAAEGEARELGHGVVGTEHLLLGLLSDDASGASAALRDAGATLAAARAKVREAVGPASRAAPPGDGPTASSARASRALGRATRFSHHRRSPVVTSEHLLEGVLDVEGTAGQVLRGLGVDVERLRVRLAGREPPPAVVADAAGRDVTSVRCPSCDAPLDDALAWGTISAVSVAGDAVRDAVVFWCGACGAALGASPA